MQHGAADLHFHSTRSDGRYEPADLMKVASGQGLEMVSLTDHDTLAGVEEAYEAAKSYGIRLVQGIEISTHYNGRGLHLLAYWDRLGRHSGEFETFLEVRLRGRRARLMRIAERLARFGVELDVDEVLRTANGAVTRAHIARQLLAQGAIQTLQEAFDRWIGNDGPAFVPSDKFPTEQAIGMVRAEGGLSVVAHPGHQELNHEDFRHLAAAGLGGIEIHHPSHPRSTRKRLRRSCRQLGLVPTGGSDWHGRAGSSLLGRGHGLSQASREQFEDALKAASA